MEGWGWLARGPWWSPRRFLFPLAPSGRGSLGPCVLSRHGPPTRCRQHSEVASRVVGWGPPELPPQGPRLLIAFLCPAVASCIVGPWLGRSQVLPTGLRHALQLALPLLGPCCPSRQTRGAPPSCPCSDPATPPGAAGAPHPVWAPAAPQVPPAHVRGLCVQLATLHAVLVHGVCGGACGTARPCGPAPAWGLSPGCPPESRGWRCVPPGSCPLGRCPQGHLLPDWSSQVMVSLIDHKGA